MGRDAHKQLVKYLRDAHAMEMQSIQMLEKGIDIAGDLQLSQLYRGHHSDSLEHERYVKQRLEALGERPSSVKNVAAQVAAKGLGVLAQGMPDTPAKLAAVAFAFENFEIASYQLLRMVAEEAEDGETIAMCDRIIPVERQAAELIETNFGLALQRSLEKVGVHEDDGPHA
jgi:ferritin-like metal-binding protein YciE